MQVSSSSSSASVPPFSPEVGEKSPAKRAKSEVEFDFVREPLAVRHFDLLSQITQLSKAYVALISTYESANEQRARFKMSSVQETIRIPKELIKTIFSYSEGLSDSQVDALSRETSDFIKKLEDVSIELCPCIEATRESLQKIEDLSLRQQGIVRFLADELANWSVVATYNSEARDYAIRNMSALRTLALNAVMNVLVELPDFDAITPCFLDGLAKWYIGRPILQESDISFKTVPNPCSECTGCKGCSGRGLAKEVEYQAFIEVPSIRNILENL